MHNATVVAELERRDAVFVGELRDVPSGATGVLFAHGVSPAVRADVARCGLGMIDVTCPLVTKMPTSSPDLALREERHDFLDEQRFGADTP
ncbi:MAG TPA: hypothetical protein VHX38_39735 [Pseudonocardiaceae bacterium]|jgi:4-hydroxy-3-methylbut-2-enyl diphosphate reductase|nr:hypothetical protein [Pseudonocardiaceae bacterium]